MGLYDDCTTEEIEAYIDLYHEPFDFGSGEVKNENRDSEYPYYNHELENRELDYLLSGFDDYEIEYGKIPKNSNRSRAWRRKKNWSKAIRKRNNGYIHLHDKPLNYLNKGKNFCSCSCCTPKTNPKGKNYFGRHKIKYKQRNWKHSDKKKIKRMDYEIDEFNSDEWFYWEWRREFFLTDNWWDKYEQGEFLYEENDTYDVWYDRWLYGSEYILEEIIDEFQENDVYISIRGGYWIDGTYVSCNKRYEIEYEKLDLVETAYGYRLNWIPDGLINDIKHEVSSKGLKIGCTDVFQIELNNGVSLGEEPTFSVWDNQTQDWIDGTYIHIELRNYHECFGGELDENE